MNSTLRLKCEKRNSANSYYVFIWTELISFCRYFFGGLGVLKYWIYVFYCCITYMVFCGLYKGDFPQTEIIMSAIPVCLSSTISRICELRYDAIKRLALFFRGWNESSFINTLSIICCRLQLVWKIESKKERKKKIHQLIIHLEFLSRAVVAQWIRRQIPNWEVPGSNLLAAAVVPLGKALYAHCLVPWNLFKAVGPLHKLHKQRAFFKWPGKVNVALNIHVWQNACHSSFTYFMGEIINDSSNWPLSVDIFFF